MQEITELTEELLTSQEGFYPMEFSLSHCETRAVASNVTYCGRFRHLSMRPPTIALHFQVTKFCDNSVV